MKLGTLSSSIPEAIILTFSGFYIAGKPLALPRKWNFCYEYKLIFFPYLFLYFPHWKQRDKNFLFVLWPASKKATTQCLSDTPVPL